MFKIAKKLTVIMLSASIIFSCSGIIAHAERVKDKKQQYYQKYEKIIKEANEKIGSKDFELLPIDEINEDDMLTPKEFQKAVNAAIQLDTQKPVIDDNGGEYSNESNDNMTARASGETVTESQNKKVSVADNHSVIMKCTATFVTRYNASKKRRFITQIKSAKVTVSGYGFSWKKSPTITKRVIDGGRTGEILCLGVIKNPSGFTKQVSLSFEFYCNTGGGIEVR